MKITSKFLTFALVAVTMVFASCSKDDDSAQKGAENFSHDIIGMWEGVEKTGDEADGNAEARIAYFADGTYIYYHKVTDVWVPRRVDASEYNIEGNKLTTRWKPEKAENYLSEWWNIDAIKDGVMKWSARRERKDGSQYTATFTWKKVDDTLTSEQIMAKLPGTWVDVSTKYYDFLKGEIINTVLKGENLYTHTFNKDGKYWDTMPDLEDPTKRFGYEYTYSVKGNVLTLITEKLFDRVEAEERVINDMQVVTAISDDELIFVNYDEMPEELIDLVGYDALLIIKKLKRVE